MAVRHWLFVGGIPRSGTTLMAHLLTLHPAAHVTSECGWPFTSYWSMTVPPVGPEGFSTAYFRSGGKEVAALWPTPRHCAYFPPEEIARGMMEGYAARCLPGAEVVGDKWPELGALHPDGSGRRIWEDLRVLWPDCKLLFMDRPIEEAAQSATRAWPGLHDVDFWREFCRVRLEGQRLCEGAKWVHHGDLQARPREVFRDVLAWLDLSPALMPWANFDAYFAPGHRVS